MKKRHGLPDLSGETPPVPPCKKLTEVTIVTYFKDGRVAVYGIAGEKEDELYARAREHAHRIVNYGFRFDYKGGCCYVGAQEIDKVEIEGMPPGKYSVRWRNL